MLKSIIWYFVIGGMMLTLEIFAIGLYIICKYKFDFDKAYRWVDVFGRIHDYPWVAFGKKIGLSNKGVEVLETIVFIATWPYAVCVAIYSAVLATKEFDRRLKEES